MHRLFVALRLPAPCRDRLADLPFDIPGARWQDNDQLHLTVRFIGEVDGALAADIAAALSSLHHPRFALALAGLGTFERRGRAGALWAGVAPHEPVAALHRKVDRALVRAGLSPERRAYLPHVTLARLGRDAAPVQPFLAAHAGLASEPAPIDAFHLYESTLGRHGASHEIVDSYRLD